MVQLIGKLAVSTDVCTAHDPAVPFLSNSQWKCIHRLIHTGMRMFIAVLFLIAKNWKPLKCPTTVGWVNKLWWIHKVEFFPETGINKLQL